MDASITRTRTVAGWTLSMEEAGQWVGHGFRFTREDPYRPRRGWFVRPLVGLFADPDGEWEPLVLNGLSRCDSLQDAVRATQRWAKSQGMT